MIWEIKLIESNGGWDKLKKFLFGNFVVVRGCYEVGVKVVIVYSGIFLIEIIEVIV